MIRSRTDSAHTPCFRLRPPRENKMRGMANAFFAIAFAMLSLLAVSQSAVARDTGLAGGPGGDFREMPCPDGYFLVGLTAGSGAWLDRVAPVCRKWVTLAGTFSQDFYVTDPMAGTSDGGTAVTESCRGTDVMNGFFAEATRDGNQPQYVNNIQIQCMNRPVVPHHFVADDTPSIIWDHAASIFQFGEYCNADEAPVGIVVRAGHYVDALGMMCGAPPPAPTFKAVWRRAPTGGNTTAEQDPNVLTPVQGAPLESTADEAKTDAAIRAYAKRHHPH